MYSYLNNLLFSSVLEHQHVLYLYVYTTICQFIHHYIKYEYNINRRLCALDGAMQIQFAHRARRRRMGTARAARCRSPKRDGWMWMDAESAAAGHCAATRDACAVSTAKQVHRSQAHQVRNDGGGVSIIMYTHMDIYTYRVCIFLHLWMCAYCADMRSAQASISVSPQLSKRASSSSASHTPGGLVLPAWLADRLPTVRTPRARCV